MHTQITFLNARLDKLQSPQGWGGSTCFPCQAATHPPATSGIAHWAFQSSIKQSLATPRETRAGNRVQSPPSSLGGGAKREACVHVLHPGDSHIWQMSRTRSQVHQLTSHGQSGLPIHIVAQIRSAHSHHMANQACLFTLWANSGPPTHTTWPIRRAYSHCGPNQVRPLTPRSQSGLHPHTVGQIRSTHTCNMPNKA